jgi:hypothetical protein
LASLSQLLALRFDHVEESAARFREQNKRGRPSADGPDGGGIVEAVDVGNPSVGAVVVGPPNACPRCMPVPGDDVQAYMDGDSGQVIVHLGTCPDLRKRLSESKEQVAVTWKAIDSTSTNAAALPSGEEYAVELQVAFPSLVSDFFCHLISVRVHSGLQVFCVDRKFLLRDVSDVVALKTEIVKTFSQTIADKAMLQYKVGLDHH